MVWYYADGDRQRGPISDEEFQDLVNNGRIHRETLLWKDGMDNWESLEKLAESGVVKDIPASAPFREPEESSTTPEPGAAEPAVAAQAPGSPLHDSAAPGRFPQGRSSRVRCAQCAKGPLQSGEGVRLGNVLLCHDCDREMAAYYASRTAFAPPPPAGAYPAAQAGASAYGSILYRAIAKFVDNSLESIVLVLIVSQTIGLTEFMSFLPQTGRTGLSAESLEALRPLLLAVLVFRVLYDGFLVGFFGATLGKMLFGLRVVTPQGGAVTTYQAFVRALAPAVLSLPSIFLPTSILGYICYFALIFGYLMAIYDPHKRTLFDHMANTRVVYG